MARRGRGLRARMGLRTKRGRRPARGVRGVLGGMAVGAASGLAATWLMTRAQTLPGRLSGAEAEQEEKEGRDQKRKRRGSRSDHEDEGTATAKVASRVSREVFDRELGPGERQQAGLAVHYAFGTAMGALYGGLAQAVPLVTVGGGTAFGAGVWLIADELVVSALKLSGPPQRQPPGVHAHALGAHLVFGASLEQARRLGHRILR